MREGSFTTDKYLIRQARELGFPLQVVSRNNFVLGRGPDYYIINLARDTDPGTHWVALYVSRDQRGFYFDSFGLPPPRVIEDSFPQGYYMQNAQIQNENSGWCGWYCLKFLEGMHKGRNPLRAYQKFVGKFRDDPEDNLRILRKLIR